MKRAGAIDRWTQQASTRSSRAMQGANVRWFGRRHQPRALAAQGDRVPVQQPGGDHQVETSLPPSSSSPGSRRRTDPRTRPRHGQPRKAEAVYRAAGARRRIEDDGAEKLRCLRLSDLSNPPRLIGDLNTPTATTASSSHQRPGFPAITVPMGYREEHSRLWHAAFSRPRVGRVNADWPRALDAGSARITTACALMKQGRWSGVRRSTSLRRSGSRAFRVPGPHPTRRGRLRARAGEAPARGSEVSSAERRAPSVTFHRSASLASRRITSAWQTPRRPGLRSPTLKSPSADAESAIRQSRRATSSGPTISRQQEEARRPCWRASTMPDYWPLSGGHA